MSMRTGLLRAAALLSVACSLAVVPALHGQQAKSKPKQTAAARKPAEARKPSADARPSETPQKPRLKKVGARSLTEETPEFYEFWKLKAELELKALQARVAAKKAEIALRDAEFEIAKIAPTMAVLERLERRVAMKFPNETPLEDVLKYVIASTRGPNDSGIQIYMDPIGLSEADKTPLSPVTIDQEGLPLRTSLRLVLHQLGLEYEVREGMMTITSEESALYPNGGGK